MTRLVLATGNAGKLAEIRDLLGDSPLELEGGFSPDVERLLTKPDAAPIAH